MSFALCTGNSFADDFASKLAHALTTGLEVLERLDVRNNLFTVVGAETIASAIQVEERWKSVNGIDLVKVQVGAMFRRAGLGLAALISTATHRPTGRSTSKARHLFSAWEGNSGATFDLAGHHLEEWGEWFHC